MPDGDNPPPAAPAAAAALDQQLANLQQQFNRAGQVIDDQARAIAQLQQQQQQQPIQNPPAQAARANQRVSKFSNDGTDDWISFKRQFRHIGRLNNYNDEQMRLALVGAMEGKAALATLDINAMDVDLTLGRFPTFAEVLDRYEQRFMPAAASQIARVHFDAARQGPHETVLDYHGRLRSLYNRAYPNAADDVALIRRFTMGLKRKELRMQTLRLNPATYSHALEAAQNESSVIQMVKVTELGAAADEPMDINSIQPANKNAAGAAAAGEKKGTCHFCEVAGHWKRDCPLWKKAQKALGGGGGGGRGQNGGRRGPPRSGQRQARNLIAALEAALEEVGDEGGEEDAQGGAQGQDGPSDF